MMSDKEGEAAMLEFTFAQPTLVLEAPVSNSETSTDERHSQDEGLIEKIQSQINVAFSTLANLRSSKILLTYDYQIMKHIMDLISNDYFLDNIHMLAFDNYKTYLYPQLALTDTDIRNIVAFYTAYPQMLMQYKFDSPLVTNLNSKGLMPVYCDKVQLEVIKNSEKCLGARVEALFFAVFAKPSILFISIERFEEKKPKLDRYKVPQEILDAIERFVFKSKEERLQNRRICEKLIQMRIVEYQSECLIQID